MQTLIYVSLLNMRPAEQLAVCAHPNSIFGISPWYACLPTNAKGDPTINSLNDIFLIIFPIVESLTKIAAFVAAGIIFFMLIQMVMARGNSGKIATAALGIRDALIGFIISLVALAIVNFVSGAFVST